MAQLVVDLEALPLLLRPALSIPPDAVHVAEELQAVPFRIVEVEGVVVARPFVLDLAAHVDALRKEMFPDALERIEAGDLHRDLLEERRAYAFFCSSADIWASTKLWWSPPKRRNVVP